MLGIIGLGYVGLPLALLSAKKGISTIGFDIDKNKIESLAKGKVYVELDYAEDWYNEAKDNFTATDNPEMLKDCNIKIICVPTPVHADKKPDFSPLISATELVAKQMQNNDLIIVESTISPGTMETKVKPILDAAGKEYYLAHCPERIDPGNKLYNVANIPRVVGGIDVTSTKLAAQFYRSIIPETIMEMSSLKAAEATKITENAFRDINIGFVNEIAMIYDELGIDILEVLEGAKTKPFSFLAHYPGIGVGGHCIPVDPYYLIDTAKEMGLNPKLMITAREINTGMAEHAINLFEEQKDKIGLKSPKIALLGIAYKQDVEDDRESPYYEVQKLLEKKNYEIISHDPFFPDKSTYKSVEETLKNSDCIIIITAHSEYRKMKIPDNIKIVIDGRNILNPEELTSRKICYRGIGRK